MKLRSISVAIAAAALGLMSSASLADSYVGTVVLTQGPYSSGVGGEFTGNTVYGASVPSAVSAFDPGATSGGIIANQPTLISGSPASLVNASAASAVFQTFCIQEGQNDVTFNPGNTYYGILTTSVASGPGTISAATAVLFDQFWNGTLANYDYLNDQSLSRQASAGALQDAIWVAEGDQPSIAAAEGDAGITGNAAAIAQATAWYNYAEAYSGPLPLDVRILELYGPTDSGTPGIAQDQLVEIPNGFNQGPSVPLPASAGMGFLLLAGLGGYAAMRKVLIRTPRIA